MLAGEVGGPHAPIKSIPSRGLTQPVPPLCPAGAAYACKSEHELGQIRPGFLADFVVLGCGGDVITTAGQVGSQSLLQAEVAQVWVHGRRRRGKADGAGPARVDGPYVPGKNGDVGFIARRWRAEQQQGGKGLEGMRAVRCCGPARKVGGGGCCHVAK